MAETAIRSGSGHSKILSFNKNDSGSGSSRVQFGGGAGGGGNTVDAETKNYVDANMRAVKAENSANFSRLEGKIDAMPSPPSIWAIAGVVGAGLGSAIAIAAFAYDRFDGGLAASAIVESAVSKIETSQSERDARQDERLDRIITTLEAINDQSQTSPHEGQD